jgi:hypothetical protein
MTMTAPPQRIRHVHQDLIGRRPSRTRLDLCKDCCRSANDAQADLLIFEGERS